MRSAIGRRGITDRSSAGWYGALSGRDLERLTHHEDPWRRADGDRKPHTSTRIPQAWIRDHFVREARDEDDAEDVVRDATEETLRAQLAAAVDECVPPSVRPTSPDRPTMRS